MRINKISFNNYFMILILLTLIILATTVPADALPALNLGLATGSSGEKVTLPVTIVNDGATSLSAIAMDIGYDPSKLENPTAVIGAAGSAADKTVINSTPLTGVFRIGAIGFTNNTVIGNGVVINVSFDIKSGIAPGEITLTNSPSASNPTGIPVTMTGTGGAITVTAGPDFTLSAPSAVAVVLGGDSDPLSSPIISTTTTDGFNAEVALHLSGEPTGVTGYFVPWYIAAPGSGSAVMLIRASEEAAIGTRNITVTATGGGKTHSANISFTVIAGPSFTLSAPPTVTVSQGSSATAVITKNVFYGFNADVVLTASGLPAGATATFSPATIPAAGSTSSTLTLTTGSTTPGGTYIVTVSGDGGGKTRTATISFTVISADTSGSIITIAGNGTPQYSGGGVQATETGFYPSSVAIDSSGNTYITDSSNNIIMKITAATGVITTVAGGGTVKGDGGPATAAGVGRPNGVKIDGNGNIFFADRGFNCIRKVTAATGIITTVAGTGNSGFHGDGGPATAATLWSPTWVAVDGNGNFYIADSGNQRIRKVTIATGVITTVAGNGTEGYSGDGGPATAASLASPNGITIDKDGNIFIADKGNSCIRKVTVATGIITTVAGGGIVQGDGGPATAATFEASDVTVDSSGNIYIATNYDNRIRKVTAATGIITTVAGNGLSGYLGDGGLATLARINHPSGVATDKNDNIYISDLSNFRIRKVFAFPDFTISASPSSLSLTQGESATASINTTVSGGFNSLVALTATGLPAGATATFSPTSIAAPGFGSAVLTISTSMATPSGTYDIIVTGTGGGKTHTTSVTLNVTKANQTISFGSAPPLVVSGTGALSATATSGLAVTFSSNSMEVCTVSGNTVTAIAVGNCIIAANQSGNDNFYAASQVTQPITITNNTTPTVQISSPAQGFSKVATHRLNYSVSYGTVTVTLDGNVVNVANNGNLPNLPDGIHTVTVEAVNSANNKGSATITFTIVTTPTLFLSTLADNQTTSNKILNMSGSLTDPSGIATFTINNVDLKAQAENFSHAVQLISGANNITTYASDNLGNQVTDVRNITLDTTAPYLTVTSPADNSTSYKSFVTVSGAIDPNSTVEIVVNQGAPQAADVTGSTFTKVVNLAPGLNTLEITATDQASKKNTLKRSVLYGSQHLTLVITNPDQDVLTTQPVMTIKGTITDALDPVTVSITSGLDTFNPPVTVGAFEQELTFPEEKLYPVTITATDQAANKTTVIRNILYSKGQINFFGNQSYTNSTLANLDLGYYPEAPNTPDLMQFLYNNIAWTKPEPYATTKTITLPKGDGKKEVSVRFIDNTGAASIDYSASIILDTIAPVGGVTIDNGVVQTNETTLHLTLFATDINSVTHMRFSEDGIWTGNENEEAYRTSFDYHLKSAGPGIKKIYVQFKDASGKWSPVSSDTIILNSTLITPVTNGSITVKSAKTTLPADPDGYTTTPAVLLTFNTIDLYMSFSTDGVKWSGWELSQSSKKLGLPAGDGTKTVYVRFAQAQKPTPQQINSTVLTGNIILDTKAPVGSIRINDGALVTKSNEVNLTLDASDMNGVVGMCITANPLSAPECGPYGNAKTVTIPAGDGVKKVSVVFKDNAGKLSKAYSDTIILDKTGPTGIVKAAMIKGATGDSSPNVVLTLTAKSAVAMLVSLDDGASWGGWEPYAPIKQVTLASTGQPQTVKVRFRDLAGNVSAEAIGIITIP